MVKRKTTLESAFQTKVIDYLHSIGAYVIKIHVSSYQLEGEPDIICCYKGRFYAFELKQGAKLSELQKIKLNIIRTTPVNCKLLSNSVKDATIKIPIFVSLNIKQNCDAKNIKTNKEETLFK